MKFEFSLVGLVWFFIGIGVTLVATWIYRKIKK